MTKTATKQQAPTPVRLDDGLLTWLKGCAVANSRSLNREIAHRLEQSRSQEAGKTASEKGEAPVIGPTEASSQNPQAHNLKDRHAGF